jgi:hypothetical protein
MVRWATTRPSITQPIISLMLGFFIAVGVLIGFYKDSDFCSVCMLARGFFAILGEKLSDERVKVQKV